MATVSELTTQLRRINDAVEALELARETTGAGSALDLICEAEKSARKAAAILEDAIAQLTYASPAAKAEAETYAADVAKAFGYDED